MSKCWNLCEDLSHLKHSQIQTNLSIGCTCAIYPKKKKNKNKNRQTDDDTRWFEVMQRPSLLLTFQMYGSTHSQIISMWKGRRSVFIAFQRFEHNGSTAIRCYARWFILYAPNIVWPLYGRQQQNSNFQYCKKWKCCRLVEDVAHFHHSHCCLFPPSWNG